MSDGGQLSILASMAQKQKGAKNMNKFSNPGWGKPSPGSMGSKLFKGRNSDAGMNKEMETLHSPIMKSFMDKRTPKTPITNSLMGMAQ